MIVLGIVVVLSTLLGSYATMQLTAAPAPEAKQKPEVIQQVKLEPMSVPIIRSGKVSGYILARFAFSATEHTLKDHRNVLTLYFSEAAFKTIYEEPDFDFSALKPVQIDGLRQRIVAATNERAGAHGIKDVFVENLSFLTPEEVRTPPSR